MHLQLHVHTFDSLEIPISRPLFRLGGEGPTWDHADLRHSFLSGQLLGAPTSFPSGETAYHEPPTPWPLVSPGFLSAAKV